ncbi:MAG TPA: DUF4062 domain-containing protein [Steroidobacteraceae bacterium]|nr:DUF4062 domain-containing protein [Steroidobacteraceae bacterium]
MEDIRVFISHTSDFDAAAVGQGTFVGAVVREIAALRGFSVEVQAVSFVAEDLSPADVIRRRMEASDIYVGIVGYAHGTRVAGDPAGRSFVEFEFDSAQSFGLPRIVFLWEDEAATSRVVTPAQAAFRARLAEKQEIVFARFNTVGDLRLALVRALEPLRPSVAEPVSGHVEWATPAELASISIPGHERRWAVHVRNAGEYPAYEVVVLVHSNNGGIDCEIDMGTIAARDVRASPYVLNLEQDSFAPDGERPEVELAYKIAGVRWRRRADGTLVRSRNEKSRRSSR